MNYNYKVFDNLDDQQLMQAWLLLQCGNDMTAFQQYEWAKTIDMSFHSNRLRSLFGKTCYFVVFCEGKPKAIFPLHVQRHSLRIGNHGYSKGIYLLGQRSYSDYLSPIYSECKADMLHYAVKSMFRHFNMAKLFLGQQIFGTAIQQLLNDSCNIGAEQIGLEHCVKLYFPPTYDEFTKGLSKNLVSNLKKQRNRRIRNHIDISYELREGACDDSSIREQVVVIHADRYRNKNKGNMAIWKGRLLSSLYGTTDEVQHSLEHNHSSWLLLGKDKGRIISYIYGLRDAKAVRIMQLGFATDYERYMPGIVTLLAYIKDNYDILANTTMDFTRGEERYKYELGGKQHTIYDYLISCSQ